MNLPDDGSSDDRRFEAVESLSDSSQSVPSDHGSAPASVASARRPRRRSRSRTARVIREYAVLAVASLVLASLVRAFLGQAYWIPSPSMYPTLKTGDRVIVSRLSFHLGDPERGDIVVFENPGFTDTGRKDPASRIVRNALEVLGIGQAREKYYIKRVIGLPGDRLQVKGDHVWINGKELAEKWLKPEVKTLYEPGMTYGGDEFTLPPNGYFMMGDNRERSQDSRYFGAIQRKKMVGRAFVRIWPLSRLGGL